MAYARIFWIALGLALAAVAQPPLKRWAGAEEYDLASQAMAERDLNRRIAGCKPGPPGFPQASSITEALVLYANDSERSAIDFGFGPDPVRCL